MTEPEKQDSTTAKAALTLLTTTYPKTDFIVLAIDHNTEPSSLSARANLPEPMVATALLSLLNQITTNLETQQSQSRAE